MRLLFILSIILSIAFTARPPHPLHQTIFNSFHFSIPTVDPTGDLQEVPSQFNINSAGQSTSRFIAEAVEWVIGDTNDFVPGNIIICKVEKINPSIYKSHWLCVEETTWDCDIPVMELRTYSCTINFDKINIAAFFEGAKVFDLSINTRFGDRTIIPTIDLIMALDDTAFTVLKKALVDLLVADFIFIRLNASVSNSILFRINWERTEELPASFEPIDPQSSKNVDSNTGGSYVGHIWTVLIGIYPKRYHITSQISVSGSAEYTMRFVGTNSEFFEETVCILNIHVQHFVLGIIWVRKEASEGFFTNFFKTLVALKVDNEIFVEFTFDTGNSVSSVISCECTTEFTLEKVLRFIPSSQPFFEITYVPDVIYIEFTEAFFDAAKVLFNVNEDSSAVPIPTINLESPDITTVELSAVQSSKENIIFSETPAATDEEENAIVPSPNAFIDSSTISNGVGEDIAASSQKPNVLSGSNTPLASLASIYITNSPSPIPLDRKILVDDKTESGNNYNLLGKVSDGSRFTIEMKNALIKVSKDSIEEESSWAFISLEEIFVPPIPRHLIFSGQTEAREYHIGLQGVYKPKNLLNEFTVKYLRFVNTTINSELEENGIFNLKIKFMGNLTLETPNLSNFVSISSAVHIIVCFVFAILILVSMCAIFVVYKSRRGHTTVSPDLTPPMTKYEVSHALDNVENGTSVKLFEDASILTVQSSRAGNHNDWMKNQNIV